MPVGSSIVAGEPETKAKSSQPRPQNFPKIYGLGSETPDPKLSENFGAWVGYVAMRAFLGDCKQEIKLAAATPAGGPETQAALYKASMRLHSRATCNTEQDCRQDVLSQHRFVNFPHL